MVRIRPQLYIGVQWKSNLAVRLDRTGAPCSPTVPADAELGHHPQPTTLILQVCHLWAWSLNSLECGTFFNSVRASIQHAKKLWLWFLCWNKGVLFHITLITKVKTDNKLQPYKVSTYPPHLLVVINGRTAWSEVEHLGYVYVWLKNKTFSMCTSYRIDP